jgi:hypothetical protein
MRQHWMAIPISVVLPVIVTAVVLWKTEHWSNGALGGVLLLLMGIAAVVGSFMAPLGPNGILEQKPRGIRRNR